jgi:hypothetical protein
MENGFVFAIIGAFLLGVIALVIIFVVISNHQNPIPEPLPNCSTKIPELEIPSDYPTCGEVPYLYYIGNISAYDFVTSPIPLQPESVCAPLCILFENGKCVDGTDSYNACLETITSTDCVGPKPLARQGETLYYANYPGSSVCG